MSLFLRASSALVYVFSMTAADASSLTCNRNIYPVSQRLDLNYLSGFRLSKENCKISPQAIQCKNPKTNTYICLKCKNNKVWKKITDDAYKCN